MVRRTRIIAGLAVTAAVVQGAALAPAAGDTRITGRADAARVSYTEDGIPYVRSGPECNAGAAGAKKRHAAQPDASRY